MNDAYQAIHDAFSQQAAGVSYAIDALRQEYTLTAEEARRPSVLYRPALYVDGDQWCALYGMDLQSGVCGFGISPDKAMHAFDTAWEASIAKKEP